MEQKYINEYLTSLGELSELELEQRDLYLRGLNLGVIEGPMTGNIYIDKPHTKKFRESLPFEFDPHSTMYSVFASTIKGRENEVAIVQPDTGRVMTYGELLSEVDKTAAGLASKGINEGSILGMFFSNSIEEAIFLLAANKLGATTKWIDYTKDPEALFLSVTEAKLDMLVIEDMLKPLEAMINPGKIPTVVCGNTGELADNHITYEQLSEMGKDVNVEAASYKPDRPAVIISSSGTTGEPKPITHSDLSVNMAARKMMYSNYDLDKDHIVMLTIPPHIGLGLITSLYTNLISGAKLAMIHCNGPEDSMHQTVGFLINYKDIVSNLYKNPNLRLVIFGAPIHVRIIASVDALQDLSFLDGFLAAGSKMSKEELEAFQTVYAAKGCTCPISNGYGQNEMAGAVAINDPIYNVNGAAGYPVIGSDVLVVDEKTGELLPPVKSSEVFMVDEKTGELLPPKIEGTILERCNSKFLYYYGMPAETEAAEVDFNGAKYFDTKDLGFMDDQGFLYITGRKARVLIRFDTKITLDKIEGKVRMLPFVKDCAALVVGAGGSFEKLALFVEPSDDAPSLTSDEFMSKVMEMQMFSYIDKPDFVEIAPIPYMNNGKINYQLLQADIDGLARTRRSGK